MTDKKPVIERKQDRKPTVNFQVSEGQKRSMLQDAKDCGESLSSLAKAVIDRYWDSMVSKRKAGLRK